MQLSLLNNKEFWTIRVNTKGQLKHVVNSTWERTQFCCCSHKQKLADPFTMVSHSVIDSNCFLVLFVAQMNNITIPVFKINYLYYNWYIQNKYVHFKWLCVWLFIFTHISMKSNKRSWIQIDSTLPCVPEQCALSLAVVVSCLFSVVFLLPLVSQIQATRSSFLHHRTDNPSHLLRNTSMPLSSSTPPQNSADAPLSTLLFVLWLLIYFIKEIEQE